MARRAFPTKHFCWLGQRPMAQVSASLRIFSHRSRDGTNDRSDRLPSSVVRAHSATASSCTFADSSSNSVISASAFPSFRRHT